MLEEAYYWYIPMDVTDFLNSLDEYSDFPWIVEYSVVDRILKGTVYDFEGIINYNTYYTIETEEDDEDESLA